MENHTLDRIEQYLKGNLSAEEHTRFSDEIAADSDLKEEIDQMQTILKIVSANGDAQFLAQLEMIDRDLATENGGLGRLKRIRWVSWAVAAAIVVLLSTWGIFQWNKTPVTPEDLFASHFLPYDAPQPIRSNSSETAGLPVDWTAYRAGDYQAAADVLVGISAEEDALSYLADFYLGQCYLMLNPPQPQLAIKAFERVLEKDHDYREQAEWYLALAYLKADDLDDSHAHFEEIATNPDHFYQEKAAKILESL